MKLIGLTGGVACGKTRSRRKLPVGSWTVWPGRALALSRVAPGKSTVSAVFAENQIPVVDADEIAKKVVQPGKPAYRAILKAFGDGDESSLLLPGPAQELDRKKLREIVFSDATGEKRKLLNHCTHKWIVLRMLWEIFFHYATGMRAVVLDAPLLFERGLDKFCSITVSVWWYAAPPARSLLSRDCRVGPFFAFVQGCLLTSPVRRLGPTNNRVYVGNGVNCAASASPEKSQIERLTKRDGVSEEQARQLISAQLSADEKKRLADYVLDNSGTPQATELQIKRFIFRHEPHWPWTFVQFFFPPIGILSALYVVVRNVWRSYARRRQPQSDPTVKKVK
ncbi:MAG: dephospho-CoA kinase-domain-containing protein [Olpidium bornovanus]|uniref:Dephospho-CoA kinase-domain-containing protein n=1 Tax=Olpidium bornovanus TaxID=278681 RepID=A0A8H7ZM46_9FUNG|nr:MAG: dephospho-CoA kinase-domain-containing protein [Olpidium bornovanus]